MKVMFKHGKGKIVEVDGNKVPYEAAGFSLNTCDFCLQENTLCLAIEDTGYEYDPAVICEHCIESLRNSPLGIETIV